MESTPIPDETGMPPSPTTPHDPHGIPGLDHSGKPHGTETKYSPPDGYKGPWPVPELGKHETTHGEPHRGYKRSLDPNVLNLKKNLESALRAGDFEGARHTLRTVIDVTAHGINYNVLRLLAATMERNRALVNESEPGRSCIEMLDKAAIELVNYVTNEAFLNTAEYKNIPWEKRTDLLDITAENVQDELCALESQLNDFVRDTIRDIKRMGHVGFGLQETPSDAPRYMNYEEECRKTAAIYKVTDQPAPKPVEKMQLVTRKPTIPPPQHTLVAVTHTRYPAATSPYANRRVYSRRGF